MHNSTKYWILAFSCWLLTVNLGKAQDTLSFATVDAKSYGLYTSENWDELIAFGNTAIAKGIDYYYLRVRMGTAYYKRENYRQAEVNFQKAKNFNSTDEVDEYLYYCYLFEGHYERARWLSKSFSHDAVTYTGSDKLKAFSFANLEAGVGSTDSTTQYSNYYYGQLGAGVYINNRFSLFQAATYFSQNTFRSNNLQFQYFASPTIPLKNGWTFSMGLQPIYLSTANKSSTKDSTLFDTLVPSRVFPHPRDSLIQRYTRPTVTETTASPKTKIEFIWAITLTKTIGNFDISFGSAIGAFDTTTQYEHYAGLTYFPLGNNKLYFGVIAYMHTENHYSSVHYSIMPSITANPFNPLTLTLSYLANNGGNLIENTGYIVSGTPDPMLTRLSFLANYAVSSAISVYGVFQQIDNIETHQHWPFQYQLFALGIKFIPK